MRGGKARAAHHWREMEHSGKDERKEDDDQRNAVIAVREGEQEQLRQ